IRTSSSPSVRCPRSAADTASDAPSAATEPASDRRACEEPSDAQSYEPKDREERDAEAAGYLEGADRQIRPRRGVGLPDARQADDDRPGAYDGQEEEAHTQHERDVLEPVVRRDRLAEPPPGSAVAHRPTLTIPRAWRDRRSCSGRTACRPAR